MDAKQLLEEAVALHTAGQLDRAEALYRQVLSADANHVPALTNLGTVRLQSGDTAEGIKLLEMALELDPGHVDAAFNRGIALQGLQRLPEALASFDRVIALRPDRLDALYARGVVLEGLRQPADALAAYDRLVAVVPGAAEVHERRGNALCVLGRFAEGLASYDRALALKPDNADAHINRGNALAELLRQSEALESYDRALALRPDNALAHSNRGASLFALARYDDALACYDRALALKPDYADAHINRGSALAQLRRHTEALESYDRALALKPDSAEAHNSRGLALYSLGRYADAMASYHRALQLNPRFAETYGNLGNAFLHRGEVREAIAAFREALELDPEFPVIRSNLLFALHYASDVSAEEVFREHRKWDEVHGEPLGKEEVPHPNGRDPGRRLRIGYVSPDFRQHSVAFFMEELLTHHDRRSVEVFCYADLSVPDAFTERLRRQAGHWRDITGMGDADAAALIRRDRIDILVDLAGHTGGNRLLVFARRPAPVQVTYLGYCDTTGLRAMDYRITDAWADPPGASERLNTEQLVRLPEGAWCFRPFPASPGVVEAPLVKAGHATFGCFNTLPKMSDAILGLWGQIMEQLPDSRLLLKCVGLGEPSLQRRLHERLRAAGIPVGRVQLLDRSATAEEHLALYGQVDIALDTFPYHGTATTCEALWMGVPVVTMAGGTHASRVGCSLLTRVGLPDLISARPQDYVNAAVALGRSAPRLAQLRGTLRERMAASALMDGPGFTGHMEQAYRQMWHHWCTSSPG